MHAFTAPRSPRRRGFTLIELLTVVAIVGILAAIVLPVVGRVRESARAAQCLSNLRQIGSAILLHTTDNRQTLPYGYDTANGQWYRVIDPYFGNTPQSGGAFSSNIGSPVLFCESETVKHDPANTAAAKRTNYSANPRVLPSNQPSGNGAIKSRLTLGSIVRPSQVVLIADGTVKTSNDPSTRGNSDYGFFRQEGIDSSARSLADTPVRATTPAGEGKEIAFRHSGKTQVVFVDGHAAAFAEGALRYKNLQPTY